MIVEIVLFSAVLLCYWYYATRLPADSPPSPPIRLPFLGHIHYLLPYGKRVNDGLDDLYRKYNKNGMFTFHMGFLKMILIGDFHLLMETFKREETNMRFPREETLKIQKQIRNAKSGAEGIINSYGKHWKEQRRFMLSTLRDFGFGKSSMEDMINEEVDFFVHHLDEQLKKNVSIQNFFNIAILNVLWRIVAGERFDYADPQLKKLVALVGDATAVGMKPNIGLVLPFFRKFFPSLDDIHQQSLRFGTIKKFLQGVVDAHKVNFDPDAVGDFIDAFLLEIRKTTDTTSSFHSSVADEHLVQTLIDLFAAGSETTSSTLAFGILHMIRNPDIQDKVRKEIHDVIGTDRPPKISDREQLPFTDATIMEIQRTGNIVPRGLPHATFGGDVKIGSFTIPKGHMIMGNFNAILRGDKYWKNGKEFDPTRFLDNNGNAQKDEKLIPFSIGKRICPGESLARTEIFLFFAGIMQKYKFEAEDPNNPPPLNIRSGITSVPEPFGVKITKLVNF